MANSNQFSSRLIKIILIAIIASFQIFLFIGLAEANSDLDSNEVMNISGGWEYKWGNNVGDTEWKTMTFPGQPQGRNGSNILWLRVIIPEGQWSDASLLLMSVYQTFEVYLDDCLIYKYGSLTAADSADYAGWGPWHILPLGQDYQSKTLSFKVYSGSSEIGIMREVRIGSSYDHLKNLVTETIDQLIIGILLLVISFFSLILFLKNPKRYEYLAFSGTAICWGIYSISLNPVKQLFFNDPLLWSYMLVLTLLPSTGFDFMLMEKLFGAGYKSIVRRIWQIHFMYSFFAVIIVLANPSHISPVTGFHEFISSLEAVAAIIIVSRIYLMGVDGKVFAIGYFTSMLFFLIDMLIDLEILHIYYKAHWGAFLFVIAVSIILVRRFSEVNNLASRDGLTGLFNRRYFFELADSEFKKCAKRGLTISLIILDIDNFKDFNDLYGHSTGDEVLKAVAGNCTKNVRNSDIVGRFGGEEIIILLPGTKQRDAEFKAERIRKSVEETAISSEKYGNLHVTASIGVSSISPGAGNVSMLFEEADTALYKAKSSGKNCVCCSSL
ncbi:MAG: GGDEF domain-containing protein [Bacillota bacterium]